MSANEWSRVWQNRCVERGAADVLAHLLRADGFHGLGGIAPGDWLSFAGTLRDRLRVAPGGSIFEVGCGAGALLYPLYRDGVRVGGIDYAARQVRRARWFMPAGEFSLGEANALALAPDWDAVVAHSVFQYFPDDTYAANVLRRMVAKARRAVAVLDVPDLAFREADGARRRAALGEAEYERRYAGLPLRYYDRAWFSATLAPLGLACTFEQQTIPGYAHAAFRYNVFIEKQS